MKKLFTLSVLLVSFCSNSQTICGTANEGGTVTLTAPVGYVFTNINFASYGTPNGSCGSFTIGGCHAVNSVSICATAFIGLNSASINATNGVFGDPCGGTFKRLYVEASYSTILPLTIAYFTAKKIEQDKVKLDWSSNHETNTSHFVVERSTDGVVFEEAGSVTARGSGEGSYSFTNAISNNISIYYYRLKVMDVDGKYQYSNIVRIHNNIAFTPMSVFPNPADKFITIISDKQQVAFLTNSLGQVVKQINLINGSVTVNVAEWNPGLYFIKAGEEVIKFVKR